MQGTIIIALLILVPHLLLVDGEEFKGDFRKLSGIIIPGFASTQLRAWSILDCPYSPLDFNPLDLVWLDTTKVMNNLSFSYYLLLFFLSIVLIIKMNEWMNMNVCMNSFSRFDLNTHLWVMWEIPCSYPKWNFFVYQVTSLLYMATHHTWGIPKKKEKKGDNYCFV